MTTVTITIRPDGNRPRSFSFTESPEEIREASRRLYHEMHGATKDRQVLAENAIRAFLEGGPDRYTIPHQRGRKGQPLPFAMESDPPVQRVAAPELTQEQVREIADAVYHHGRSPSVGFPIRTRIIENGIFAEVLVSAKASPKTHRVRYWN